MRFPLAFDGKLLGQVLRIFTDTVAAWYRERQGTRGLPDGETGAVTAIQRANSDLRLNPHFHTLFLDAAARSQVVPHTPPPADVESDPEKTKRNLKYLRWSELLRRVFGIEVVCAKCDRRAQSAREVAGRAVRPGVPWDQAPLRLISLIKSEPIAKKILVAMHLVPSGPRACPPCPCLTRASHAPAALGCPRASPSARVARRTPGIAGWGRLPELTA